MSQSQVPSYDVFGKAVSLPTGWSDATVHAFFGPAFSDADRLSARGLRPSVTVVSLGVGRKLEDWVADLEEPDIETGFDVIAADYKVHHGQRYFERVLRYADPETNLAVQQASRLQLDNDKALLVTYTTLAHDFDRFYPAFADVSEQMHQGAPV